jgi:hypothetical protein
VPALSVGWRSAGFQQQLSSSSFSDADGSIIEKGQNRRSIGDCGLGIRRHSLAADGTDAADIAAAVRAAAAPGGVEQPEPGARHAKRFAACSDLELCLAATRPGPT